MPGSMTHDGGMGGYGSSWDSSPVQPPKLYPEMQPEQMPRATPQIGEAEGFEIREMREMRHYMLNYGHRIKHEPSSKELERYSDKYRHNLRPTSVWGSITAAAAHAHAIFPAELTQGRGPSDGAKSSARSKTPTNAVPKWYEQRYEKKFSQLEEREKRTEQRAGLASLERRRAMSFGEQDGADENEFDGDGEQEEELESENDYAIGFEGDDDYGMGDGSDGEPTF